MPLDGLTLSPVLADLYAARDYIEDHGWCQRFAEDGGRVCTMGGVFAVTGGRSCTPEEAVRRQAAFDALQETLAGSGVRGPVSFWNDAPERTKEDVLALYGATIRAQQRGGS